jgi:DNA (cytosine-5)-methyltransferase 1
LDLFAGTGWGVACQRLGMEEMGVEIMPEAVATREANGMQTIFNNVWDGLADPALVPAYDLLIASPPCQTFSLAGKGSGRKSLDDVLGLITSRTYTLPDDRMRKAAEDLDDRTALVLTPLAYIWRDRPRLAVFEQVPTVLPVWEACAEVMRDWGYSVDVGVLNAEQYGVPQTRKRAILVARLDGEAKLPAPTHSRYYPTDPQRLDSGVLPWVSMADALGWGMTDAPMPTITAGTHGPSDRWASGGSGTRKMIDAKIGGPNWKSAPETSKTDARTTYATRIGVDEAAVLQTYPPAARGLSDRPSPTITGGGTETGGAEPIAKFHARYTSSPGWVGSKERLSIAEAAALQTFPPKPFVWPCTKTKAFLQIGNAVPPLLAQSILTALVLPAVLSDEVNELLELEAA